MDRAATRPTDQSRPVTGPADPLGAGTLPLAGGSRAATTQGRAEDDWQGTAPAFDSRRRARYFMLRPPDPAAERLRVLEARIRKHLTDEAVRIAQRLWFTTLVVERETGRIVTFAYGCGVHDNHPDGASAAWCVVRRAWERSVPSVPWPLEDSLGVAP